MGKAEWGGNPVCWWLSLYFCFVCCLDEASCIGCYWWLEFKGLVDASLVLLAVSFQAHSSTETLSLGFYCNRDGEAPEGLGHLFCESQGEAWGCPVSLVDTKPLQRLFSLYWDGLMPSRMSWVKPWTPWKAWWPWRLHYSCPETSMERGDWWATVNGVARSWTQRSF